MIDRVAQELGLILSKKGPYLKVEGPSNKHRIYVMESKFLGRIDTTLDVLGQPGTTQLNQPNGSIRCHIEPNLEHLETFLRMLGDSSLGKQVPNKHRPFGAVKQPSRTPRPTAQPVQVEDVQPVEYIAEGGTLAERIEMIKAGVRRAKIRLLVEEKGMTREEAEAHLDRRVEDGDRAAEELAQARQEAEVKDIIRETGVEVS